MKLIPLRALLTHIKNTTQYIKYLFDLQNIAEEPAFYLITLTYNVGILEKKNIPPMYL